MSTNAKPFAPLELWIYHYSDVIMDAMASDITNTTIVYSIVYLSTDQKKHHKTPRHWPFWGEFIGDRGVPRTKGQWGGKCFHLMTSSCWLCAPLRYARQQLYQSSQENQGQWGGKCFHLMTSSCWLCAPLRYARQQLYQSSQENHWTRLNCMIIATHDPICTLSNLQGSALNSIRI